MDYVKDVKELAEAGFTVEKIARIVYGDAHPMCVELVNIDLSEVKYREDRGAIALFFDEVLEHQREMERGAWFSNHVLPLVGDLEEDELVEVCGKTTQICNNCKECLN